LLTTSKPIAHEDLDHFSNILCINELRIWTITPPTYDALNISIKELLQGGFIGINTYYSLHDNYPEPGLNILSDGSSLLINDPIHELVDDAMEQLDINHYYRHVKTHAFKRFPSCFSMQPKDPFVNHYYVPEGGGECAHSGYFEPGSTVIDYYGPGQPEPENLAPWLRRIGKQSINSDLRIGFYHRAMSDFFFQMDYQTGNIGAGTNNISPSICRTWQVEFPMYPGTAEVFNPAIPVGDIVTSGSLFPNSEAEEGFDLALSNQPENPPSSVYYLCVNSSQWRQRLNHRSIWMGCFSDFVVFDVNHMPKGGCFCMYCRSNYRNINNVQNTDANFHTVRQTYDPNISTNPEDFFLEGGLAFDPFQSSSDGWSYNNAARRLNADLMNSSLITHFVVLQQGLHEHFSAGVVSTGEFPGMMNDAHRSTFVRTLDIPKGEWTMPTKRVNNSPFYLEGDPLTDHKIPDDVRLMGSISMFRDASQHRLAFIWLDEGLLRNYEFLAHGLNSGKILHNNNQMLRTWTGAGAVCGVINTTTLPNFFELTANGTPVTFDRSLCHLDPTIDDTEPGECPNANLEDKDIIRLANEYYGLTAGKRPYMDRGIYFSEINRNNQLYALDVANPLNTTLPRRAMQRVVMPALLAFQSQMEAPTEGQTPDVFDRKRIYPTGFILDDTQIPTTVNLILAPAGQLGHLLNNNNLPIVTVPMHNLNIAEDNYYLSSNATATNTLLQTLSKDANDNALNPSPFYIEMSGNAPKVYASFFTPTSYAVNPNVPSALTVPLVVDPVWGISRGSWLGRLLNVNGSGSLATVTFEIPSNEDGAPPITYTIPVGITDGSYTIAPLTITPPSPAPSYTLTPNKNYLGRTISWTYVVESGVPVRYFTFNGQQYPVRIPGAGQKILYHFLPYGDPMTSNSYDYEPLTCVSAELHIRTDAIPNITQVNFYDDDPDTPPLPLDFTTDGDEHIIMIPPFTHCAVIDIF
jgi:hypothetical protein